MDEDLVAEDLVEHGGMFAVGDGEGLIGVSAAGEVVERDQRPVSPVMMSRVSPSVGFTRS